MAVIEAAGITRVSMIIGNLFGYVSEKGAGRIAAISGGVAARKFPAHGKVPTGLAARIQLVRTMTCVALTVRNAPFLVMAVVKSSGLRLVPLRS